MLSVELENLRTKWKSIRVLLSGVIYQYLFSGDGIALPVHSINYRHDAYILQASHFTSLMDACGRFLTSKYGCMCLIKVEDHFVRSFAILTHMNMHDQNIRMIVSEMSG